MRFNFECKPPEFSKIPKHEIVGVTAILLTCSYNEQEFFRVGYYINNFYEEQELNENPPDSPILDKLTRHILLEKPRVTRFQIDWDIIKTISAPGTGMFGGEVANAQPASGEIMGAGTQAQDRQNMMSEANLAEAAQSFANR